MTKVITSFALEPELRFRLDAEAERLDRSRNWLATKILRTYLGSPDDLFKIVR
jgi:predicted transcriptional regulator